MYEYEEGYFDPYGDGIEGEEEEAIQFEVMLPGYGEPAVFTSPEDALDEYQSQGEWTGKRLGAVIPASMSFAGTLNILQQIDGYDVILNADIDQPEIAALHQYFEGTPVEDAFRQANYYLMDNYPVVYYVWQAGQTTNKMPLLFSDFDRAFSRFKEAPGEKKHLFAMPTRVDGKRKGYALLAYENQAYSKCPIPRDMLDLNGILEARDSISEWLESMSSQDLKEEPNYDR